MRTLTSLDSPIHSLVVSPDGSTVVTASNEGLGFLDLASGQHSVTPLEEEVSRLTWGPHGLLAGTLSGEVWTVGRNPARLFEAIDEEISGIAASSDGTIAVCGGDPCAVATFGRHGNEEWRSEPDKWPYCVRFSPDGKLLALATWDGYLFVFDVHDLPDELSNLDGDHAGGPIFDAAFVSSDRVVVAGASFVRVWDRGAGTYIANRELDAEAFAVAVSPDGSYAVVSTNDQNLRLFALPDLTPLGQLGPHAKARGPGQELTSFPDYAEFCRVKGPATVRTLAFHPDGTRVFACTEDRRLIEVARAEIQQVAGPATRLAPHELATGAPASAALGDDAHARDALAVDDGWDLPPTDDELVAVDDTTDVQPADESTDEAMADEPSGHERAARGGTAARGDLAGKHNGNKTRASRAAATRAATSNAAASKRAPARSTAGSSAASKPADRKPTAPRLATAKRAGDKPAGPRANGKTSNGRNANGRKSTGTESPGRKLASRKSASSGSTRSTPASTKSAGRSSASRRSTTSRQATSKPATRSVGSRSATSRSPAKRVGK